MLVNYMRSTGKMEGVSGLHSLGSQGRSRDPRTNRGTTGTIPNQASIFVFSASQAAGDSVCESGRRGHSHQDSIGQEKGTTQGMRAHSSKDGDTEQGKHLQKSLATRCERAGTMPYLRWTPKPAPQSAYIKVCSLEQNKLQCFPPRVPPNPL